jgi:RND family efflux transporter MFP subunit
MNPLLSDHPAADDLVAFALGRLPEGPAAGLEAHLAGCEACRGAVDRAPADSFVAKVQAACSSVATACAGPGGDPPTRSLPPGRPAADIPADLAAHPRYRLIELLGAGGMGAVFKAEHLLLKRTVAVKVINRALFADPAVTGRFGREMEAAGKLTHPNIVHAYDAEGVGDTHFLAMEYVEGVSLAKLAAQRGPLPVAEACCYVRQAALGLQHAHERGMVHRDIKPQNLMVTPDGQVKILDFGLARFVLETAPASALRATADATAFAPGDTPAEPLTQAGTVMGTPAYIAPEQARDPHTADIRADIYSLGCTFYDLLTGRPPFPEGTARRKVTDHLETAPRSLCELRADVPRELAGVVDRMLAKDPARRYQTPAEVAAALAPWAREMTIGEGPSPEARPANRMPLPCGRRPRRVRLALAASAVIAVGLLGFTLGPPVQDLAQTVVRVVTNQGVLVIEAEDQDLEITVKRDGTDESVTARVSKGGKEVIVLRAGDLRIDARLPGGDCFRTTELTLARGGKKFLTARLLLASQGADAAPSPVLVSRPVERTVTDYEEFTGRANAPQSVTVTARVSGFLEKVMFREGDVVHQGEVLCAIDARPVKALADQAGARVQKLEARLKDKAAPAEAAEWAELKAAKAELEQREFELSATRIVAPIDGRIGRLYVATGQQVTADKTVLTEIVSEDPLYGYFDVPEATALRILPLLRPKAELVIRLADDTEYGPRGVVDFVNNRVENGVLVVRARLPNPVLPAGHRRLTAGLLLRARLAVGAAHPALLVKYPGPPAGPGAAPQESLYLVDDQNKVVRRGVKWGQEHDGLTVVREGLQAGDRVIVGWTEVPQPGQLVTPRLVEMPGNRPPPAAPKVTPPLVEKKQ